MFTPPVRAISTAAPAGKGRADLTAAARPLQFFDVKEANDRTAALRETLRVLIRRARGTPTLETLFLRRHIADLWTDYRAAAAASHEMTATYLAQIHARNFTRFSLASAHTRKPAREAA